MNQSLLHFVVWLTAVATSVPASPAALLPRTSQISLCQVNCPHRLHYGALPQERSHLDLTERVVARLVEAEARESNAWYRDDYRIARVLMGLAREGSPIPHIEATYMVLGIHPDHVWQQIELRRHAALGDRYQDFFGGASSPKKPAGSVTLEEFRQRQKPKAA